MIELNNLHQYKWIACKKLNDVIDSCENLQELELIEDWVMNTTKKFNIDIYWTPSLKLRIKLIALKEKEASLYGRN